MSKHATKIIINSLLIVVLLLFWMPGCASSRNVTQALVPKYVAWVRYQVLPPQNIENKETISSDEIVQFIARQRIRITDDALLEDVLKTDAFQYDYHDMDQPAAARRKSPFLLENAQDPKSALKKAIEIIAIPNTDLYQLTMSGNDPKEIAEQVQAFAMEYVTYLKLLNRGSAQQQLDGLKETLTKLQQRVNIAKQANEHFRVLHDIPGIISKQSRDSQSLASMDTALVAAQTEANQARSNAESIQNQIDNNTFKLPVDLQTGGESDEQLIVDLGKEKKALESERKVMLDAHGPDYPAVKDLDNRMAACQKQIDDLRNEMAARTPQMVLDKAQKASLAAQAREQDLRARRNDLLLEVKDLDKWIVEFKVRQEDIVQHDQLLSKLNQKILLLQVQSDGDAARIRRVGQSEVP